MTTEHGHFRKVCACGRVLEQCRCPGPKHETVVAPCRHQDKVVEEPVGPDPAYVDIAGRLHARATPDGKLEVYVDLEEDGDIPATRVSMTMDAGGGLTLLNELAVALRALSLAYPNPPPKP